MRHDCNMLSPVHNNVKHGSLIARQSAKARALQRLPILRNTAYSIPKGTGRQPKHGASASLVSASSLVKSVINTCDDGQSLSPGSMFSGIRRGMASGALIKNAYRQKLMDVSQFIHVAWNSGINTLPGSKMEGQSFFSERILGGCSLPGLLLFVLPNMG